MTQQLHMMKLYSHTTRKQKLLQKILMKKNITCKIQNFYILIAFLLITIELLIAVSIYCYLIEYRAKQKHLLPFQDTNNGLKQVLYIDNINQK